MTINPPLVTLLSGALLVSLGAQPSTAMRPQLLESLEIGADYSSREILDRGSLAAGEARVSNFSLSVAGRRVLDPETTLLLGLAYATHEVDATTPWLPDRLAEVSLNLGLQRRLTPQWTVAAYLRPGFYGDFEDLSGDSFNVPALILGSFAPRKELVWSAGLNANAFSDNPVLPVLGLRWQFARDWTFNLAFPRSGFTRQVTERFALRAGVSFAGGNFRVTRNLGIPAPGVNRLANTYLDYREVRAGVGADFDPGSGFSLALELGAVTDRKFDYFDRNYRLDSDGGFFGSVSIRGRF